MASLRRIAATPTARALLVVALAAGAVATTTAPADAATVTRIAGDGRVATSVEVALRGWDTAPHVLLTTAHDYPDAVAATALAARLDAPMLMTPPDRLPERVREALRRLDASEVTILGGTGAVSGDVERELLAMGIVPHRIAGRDRYDTAARIADEATAGRDVPVVAVALGAHPNGGDAWPDALSAASLAGLDLPVPTLLTEGHRLSDATRGALRDLRPERVIILGGDAAVGNDVADQIAALGPGVSRAHGDSRYSTAVDVAEAAIEGPHAAVGTLDARQAIVVYGGDFPDALAASALAVRREAPLLLTPTDRLDDTVDAFVRGDGTDLASATIVGGSGAVSGFVAEEIDAALTGEPRPQREPACPPNSSPDCRYTYEHPIETWERLARCESGGNWSINSGNGFYGGLQFSLSSWRGVGGSGYPHEHPKWEQIHRGELLQDRQGWDAWPHCSRELGLR